MTGALPAATFQDVTLQEWIDRHGRGAHALLHRRSGVSHDTIRKVLSGEKLDSVRTAQALSEATEGQVSARLLLGLDTGEGGGEDE